MANSYHNYLRTANGQFRRRTFLEQRLYEQDLADKKTVEEMTDKERRLLDVLLNRIKIRLPPLTRAEIEALERRL